MRITWTRASVEVLAILVTLKIFETLNVRGSGKLGNPGVPVDTDHSRDFEDFNCPDDPDWFDDSHDPNNPLASCLDSGNHPSVLALT